MTEVLLKPTAMQTSIIYLNTPEKMEHLKNLSRLVHTKEKEIQDLRSRLVKVIAANIRVDDGVHQDLLNIMNLHKNQHSNESYTFASTFWNQQFKVAMLKNTKQMKWHPAMIHWCLYLHHRSSGTLRNSSVITLPTDVH